MKLNAINNYLIETIQYEMRQMLEKLSKSPCYEDIAFAQKKVVAKRNRYKDRFPCELGFIK